MMRLAELKNRFDHSILYSLISGLLLIASFPKFGQGCIAWIALIPLIYALNSAHRSKAFSLGFLTGLISQIGILYWIIYVVVQYGNLPYYLGISAMMLVALYLSLYTGIFAWGIVYLKHKNIPFIISSPALWSILEYTKSQLFTGFPWENLGYSQYLYIPVIQIADITGVYGITFLIVMVNVSLADLLTMQNTDRKKVTKEVISVCLMIIISITYGFSMIKNIRDKSNVSDNIDIFIVQGNIDQNIKWNPDFQKETNEIYMSLSSSDALSRSSLIVWPETATPFFFQDMNDMHKEVVSLAKRQQSWLLFGSPGYFKKGNDTFFTNSAFLLSPEGHIIGRYDKVHLVPYGEYVPLRQWFPFISKFVVGVGDFSPGEGFYPLYLKHHKIGVLICYEGIFPEAARSYKIAGSDLLVNITNDAWFGTTSAPYQHLSMTTFRAVENRLYIARSANTGISAVIDPTGMIVARTNLFETVSLKKTVSFRNDKTFYMLYGDVFIFICIGIIVVCIIIPMRRRNHA